MTNSTKVPKDKTIYYHNLKNLHYQNVYLHFIYRNTQRAMMRQRNVNFWRILEIPLFILTLINLFIIFFTNNVLISGLSIVLSIVATTIAGLKIHDHYIKRQNQKDEEIMDFNSVLIRIQNLQDQIEIIDIYNISNRITDRGTKIEELENLIENNLTERFKSFQGQSIEYIENFLYELGGFNPAKLRERLESLQKFMEKVSQNYQSKIYYQKLNTMMQYLRALYDDNEDENYLIQNLFEN